MKSIFVDTQTFLKNPKLYVNIMHEFGSSITKEAMLTTLEHNCFYFFAFDDKGKVQSWGRCAKPYGRKTMWCIRQIQTKEESQGLGYASLLYRECEKYLEKTAGAKKIYAFVDQGNIKSIRFHEKMSYCRAKKVSKEIREKHGWDSAIMFEKHIEKTIEKELKTGLYK